MYNITLCAQQRDGAFIKLNSYDLVKISDILAIDEILGLSLLIPALIILLAYIWKFCLNYQKAEEASRVDLRNNVKIKIPVKKFFEA